MRFIGGGELQNLSEEELVQCAQSAGHGCKGGEMQAAFDWILNSENGFMDNEADYPYTSGGGNTGNTFFVSDLGNKDLTYLQET